MSIYGSWQTAVISSGQTTSAEVDLGRDYDFLQIQIPTITQAQISLTCAELTGGTFRALGETAKTKATTGNFHTVFKLMGYEFIKVVSSVAQGGTRTFKVRGGRF